MHARHGWFCHPSEIRRKTDPNNLKIRSILCGSVEGSDTLCESIRKDRYNHWAGTPLPVIGRQKLELPIGLTGSPRHHERVLVLARDPAVIAAAQTAARRLRRPPAVVTESGQEALAHLAAPGNGPLHLICDPAAAGPSWPHLLATLSDPSTRTALILVSTAPEQGHPGVAALPADSLRVEAALQQPAPQPAQLPREAATALRDGLSNGEIAVRYQPMVRIADGRPVMVEALARWDRAPTPISPKIFVPLAERTGLGRALSVAVATRAAAEMAPLWPRLRLGLSINLPLDLLLQPDLLDWLRRALKSSGLQPWQVALELTETSIVRDSAILRRAVLRLRQAGYAVLLDDIMQHDERGRLLDLPFAGFKLDRSLVEALPAAAHARHEVRRLVRLAEARGQTVIAEGVADARLWAAVRRLGVHLAQGFGVGRPLPAAALPSWWASWRGRQPG